MPQSTSKSAVLSQIYEEVEHEDWEEGGSYHGNLTWHDNRIYDTLEEAEAAIDRFDNGWYDDHAVLFREAKDPEPTRELLRLQDWRKRTVEQKEKFTVEHSVHTLSAKFIGCTGCGSKISREHLRKNTENCPVCGHDLRAEYIGEKIREYDAKIKQIDERIADEQRKIAKKNAKDAEIFWLVKYEYHV